MRNRTVRHPILITRARAVLTVSAVVVSCGETGTDPPPPPPPSDITLVAVVSGLATPVYLTAPVGDARLFVVEKTGRVRIVRDGVLVAQPFLDLSGRVSTNTEQGLLSVAFHPDYASNGFVFVSFTDRGGTTRIERYRVSPDPDVVDPGSPQTILTVSQPFSNHNGGLIAFGPDGLFYVGLGDGGSAGDPRGHGQNTGTLLGNLLRIDVNGALPYAIPPDNPFVNDPLARDEIWAYGLRNPWRWAFDDGSLYLADVGQDQWEEINVVPADQAGLNYGWNVTEGNHCFGSDSCDQTGLVMPALEYDHGTGCSVTGGFVYRGDALPEIRGQYFYADFCAGWVRSFRYEGGTATDVRQWSFQSVGTITSFGRDAAGELYVLAGGGTVFRIARATQ